MRFNNISLILLGSIVNPAVSFAPISSKNVNHALSKLNAKSNDLETTVKTALSGAVLATALWTAPATLAGQATYFPNFANGVVASSVAGAKEMASGSGSRVNKDAESLLRYGLPIDNKEVSSSHLVSGVPCACELTIEAYNMLQVRELQKNIESIKQNVSSKRKTAALDDLKKAKGIINTKESKMTSSCRDASTCSSILKSIKDKMGPLEEQLTASTNYLNGSDQERIALDESYTIQDGMQKELSDLEEQMVPAGYITPVPSEYNDLPQLQGRATVEMVLKKPDGESFDIEGKLFKDAKMKMVIDGYAGK